MEKNHISHTSNVHEAWSDFLAGLGKGAVWLDQAWWLPWAIGIAILLAGFYFGRCLASYISKAERAFTKAELTLAEAHDADAFAIQYEQINARMADDSVMRHHWREFSETLILPQAPNERVGNTIRPRSYFDINILSNFGANLDLFRSLPNIFVGIGLLFTFVFLIAALYHASQGVASGSTEEAQKALRALLQSATSKFVTSVFGLGTSVVFSVWKKRRLHRLDEIISQFCHALEIRMDFVAPARLHVESQQELKKQTAQLERFNTDLAMSIAGALEPKIVGGLTHAIEPVVSALQGLAGKFGEMNQGALDRMITQFSEKLEGAAGQQVQSVVDSLVQVKSTIDGLIGGVDNVNRALSEQMGRSAEDLRTRIDEASHAIQARLTDAGRNLEEQIANGAESLQTTIVAAAENLDEAVSTASEKLRVEVTATIEKVGVALSPLAERLAGMDTTLSRLHGQLDSQMQSMSELTHQLDVSIVSLGATAGEIEKAARPIQIAASGLQTSGAHLSKVAQAFEGLSGRWSELDAGLRRISESLASAWDTYGQRFEALDASLEEVFRQLQNGLDAFANQVQDFVRQTDNGMAEAVGRLSTLLQQLDDMAGDVKPVVQDLRNAVTKLAEALESQRIMALNSGESHREMPMSEV